MFCLGAIGLDFIHISVHCSSNHRRGLRLGHPIVPRYAGGCCFSGSLAKSGAVQVCQTFVPTRYLSSAAFPQARGEIAEGRIAEHPTSIISYLVLPWIHRNEWLRSACVFVLLSWISTMKMSLDLLPWFLVTLPPLRDDLATDLEVSWQCNCYLR